MERPFFAMHPYEAMFILQPGLGDEGVNGFVGKVTGLLTENGAEMVRWSTARAPSSPRPKAGRPAV